MKAMNWDDIRYFLAVVEGGSLSAAARSLAVEHSTVGRRVDMLEQQLGVRLFERLPRSWQLTEEGKALVEPARRISDGAQGFLRVVNATSSMAGRVRISVPPLLGSHILARHLNTLRRQLPLVKLEIVGDLQDTDLHRGEADIALRMRRPDKPDLATRPLAKIEFGLYAGREYLQTRRREHWEYVGYEQSMQTAPQQQWLESQVESRSIVFRSNDLHMLANAIVHGVGVGVLPLFFGQSLPQLQLLSEPACPVVRDLWLVVHPDVRRSPRVRAVADAIIQLFESGAAVVDSVTWTPTS